MPTDESSGTGDDLASLVSGISLGGRSLHPSVAGSACSMACSEATIGAGDDTGYWDYKHREATRSDLGHNCRECRKPFSRIGEPITERRGARTSMRYHAECFSGFADPRSQASSSHHTGRCAGTQFEAAPQRKAGTKMRSSAHFEGGAGDSRYAGASGKLAGYAVHGGGFGAASSKLNADSEAPPPPRPTAPGDLTESALAQHLALQNLHTS
tara:strand:- start:108 stop:743 length:636 start_codon:yes stop_codon:yes gene_type:complete